MKVIQINSIYKQKSTGRTCWEVEKALIEHGHDSLIIHQNGPHEETGEYVVNSKFGYLLHKGMSRLWGLDGYYSRYATLKTIKTIRQFEPDIIHLRNLHGGYLNLPYLFKYLSSIQIPIILNLHDTWGYTGKCPEYESPNCFKWKTHCRKCPQWKGYPKSWLFDRSKKMFEDKKKWYSALKNLTVLAVSDYIKEESEQSPMFVGRRIERIYNWIDLERFRPYDKSIREDTRKKYELDNRLLVVSVSSYWKKNTEYDEICLLAKELGDEIQVCLVGGNNVFLPYDNMIHISNIESIDEMARIYSSADVFVSLSTAESFGKAAAEAMACGTPIIVYNTTGIREIPNEKTGFCVEKHDLAAIKQAIMSLTTQGENNYIEACRNRAYELFDYKKNVQSLLQLYEELIYGNK